MTEIPLKSDKALEREQAIALLERIRTTNRESFYEQDYLPYLARYITNGTLSIEEVHDAYRETINTRIRENPLSNPENHLHYLHGVEKILVAELQDVPFSEIEKRLKPEFLRKVEIPLRNVPGAFYEEYTLDSSITNVGATAGDFSRHSTLIFLGEKQIGKARIKNIELYLDREIRDYGKSPCLEEKVELILYNQNCSSSFGYNETEVEDEDAKIYENKKDRWGYVPYSELSLPIPRRSIVPKLNWEIIRKIDPHYVLDLNIDNPYELSAIWKLDKSIAFQIIGGEKTLYDRGYWKTIEEIEEELKKEGLSFSLAQRLLKYRKEYEAKKGINLIKKPSPKTNIERRKQITGFLRNLFGGRK